jgi:hypothetical protein
MTPSGLWLASMSGRCSSWLRREHHCQLSPVARGGSIMSIVVTAPATCSRLSSHWPAGRHVEVTERRTAVDFAHQMKWLVDEAYPDVEVVRVVLDNLNVHTTGSPYVAFPPAEARRIARMLEFHFTPKHGSWLNVAECELAVLASQCLARRLGTIHTARHEVAAWERQRNVERPTVNWHFTTAQARRKLNFLYPDPA